ncbi:MAG TPA: DUF4188 domain-containing protein [Mycobacteriales bacterium]|nr:DUF4188 domain-containing protein [Mycobacteriales bacterium]
MGSKVETVPQVADPTEGTVVFLIGMRVNKWWLLHRWIPAFYSMIPMLIELNKNKETTGFLSHQTWFGRTVIVVQYWRSMGELLTYARNNDHMHHPQWRKFNRYVNNNGSVGIYHEAYEIVPSRIHTVYRNMPPFGLGKATAVRPQRPLAFTL